MYIHAENWPLLGPILSTCTASLDTVFVQIHVTLFKLTTEMKHISSCLILLSSSALSLFLAYGVTLMFDQFDILAILSSSLL